MQNYCDNDELGIVRWEGGGTVGGSERERESVKKISRFSFGYGFTVLNLSSRPLTFFHYIFIFFNFALSYYFECFVLVLTRCFSGLYITFCSANSWK